MLLDELQQALDLVVAGLEGDEGTQASLQAARPVLAYAVACSAELEPSMACVVSEVCRGLQDTVEHVLHAHALVADGPRDSEVHEQHQQRLMLEYSDGDDEDEDVAGSTAAAESVQILHQCQRHVSGSLQEVAGMNGVKKELESAVLWPLRMPHLLSRHACMRPRVPACIDCTCARTLTLVCPPPVLPTCLSASRAFASRPSPSSWSALRARGRPCWLRRQVDTGAGDSAHSAHSTPRHHHASRVCSWPRRAGWCCWLSRPRLC
jgi:hypothetical protein